MRRSQFQKSIKIQRRRDSKNEIMSTESEWITLYRSISCEIEAVSVKEQRFQRRESVEKEFRVYCEYDLDVTEKDRVIGRESPLQVDNKYEIIGVSHWDNHMILRLRRWQ